MRRDNRWWQFALRRPTTTKCESAAGSGALQVQALRGMCARGRGSVSLEEALVVYVMRAGAGSIVQLRNSLASAGKAAGVNQGICRFQEFSRQARR